MLGVRADGRKELVAITDGYRESCESWADLLRDCKRRGMAAPVLAALAARVAAMGVDNASGTAPAVGHVVLGNCLGPGSIPTETQKNRYPRVINSTLIKTCPQW